jgi:hypothetical protein
MLRTFALIACAAYPLAAQDLQFSQPIDCTLGADCFIEDYVDINPFEKNSQDHRCGLNTRDGHTGTDFALIDFASVEQGVDVLAAAPGHVFRLRDSMPDDLLQRGVTSQNACGNAVILAHADGYQTTYCHLKRGSINVSIGDSVERGQPIGKVGLSGRTSHPHVHFSVKKNGTQLDPFRPEANDQCATQPSPTLWLNPPEYHATILRFAGFSNAVPKFEDTVSGAARLTNSKPNQPLVVYVEAGFSQHGDILDISATGPLGEAFRHSILLKQPKKSTRRAFGKRAPQEGWSLGEYTGQIILTRKGQIIANRFAHVTVAH